MSGAANLLVFLAAAIVYFSVLTALFRLRARIGLGAFFCALGAMHFLETYLASMLYVALPFGLVASPGSTVLFTGKLMLLLMVYIREDAIVVRQPIYGLLIGNLLLFALAFLMRQLDIAVTPARAADFGLLDEMGALMVWGTGVLFVDCIMLILVYERTRVWLGDRVVPRLWLSATLVMTFDHAAFFIGLHLVTDAPLSVLFGGWIAKMAAVAVYSGLAGIYLRLLERPQRDGARPPRIADVFDMLTYRERYEQLLARSGRDALTGLLDRGRLELQGRRQVEEAARAGRPLALLIVDIDHFKSFNDRFGHAAGDLVLKQIASVLMATVRKDDAVYRFGGEEFVVIADDMTRSDARLLGERIRREVASHTSAARLTVSIGLASCAEDASDYDGLFTVADGRLYRAKAEGRNHVTGDDGPQLRQAPPNGVI